MFCYVFAPIVSILYFTSLQYHKARLLYKGTKHLQHDNKKRNFAFCRPLAKTLKINKEILFRIGVFFFTLLFL